MYLGKIQPKSQGKNSSESYWKVLEVNEKDK